MPRDSKNDSDSPAPYRRYRVPDPTVEDSSADNSNVDDTQEDAGKRNPCGVLFAIGVSFFSILLYLAGFGLIAWMIASMLGMFD